MKKAPLLLVMAILTAPLSARADIHHRMSSSVALQVDAAQTSVSRIGTTFSISGNNVTTTITPDGGSAAASLGGLVAPASATAAATVKVPDATQTVAGNAFSFTTSITAGDAIVTNAPTTGAVTGYSNQYSTAGGDEDELLAGSVTSAHAFSGVHAGGAGTTATSQFVTELTVR